MIAITLPPPRQSPRHRLPLPPAQFVEPYRFAGVHLAYKANDALGVPNHPLVVANSSDELVLNVDLGGHALHPMGTAGGNRYVLHLTPSPGGLRRARWRDRIADGASELIIDDNVGDRELLKCALAETVWNAEVREAARGDEALDSLRHQADEEQPPELIITKYMLMGETCMEVIPRIRGLSG